MDERSVEISIPNEMGYERIVMESSASFAKMLGFVPDRIEDLKTAVAEACLNAMQHGNKGRLDARVVVTMKFDDEILSVSVRDEGDGISELPDDNMVREQIDRMEPPKKGVGVYLIKHLVDEVEFNEVTGEGHAVRMAIRLTNRDDKK